MAFMMLEVVMCEQHLRHLQVVSGEQFRVRGHEPGLADGGAGLQFGKFSRAPFQSERAHAGADRAGGDHHDFAAGAAQSGHLRDELFQLRRVGLLAAVREHTRAEFHHHAGGGFERVTMHAPRLKKIRRAENVKIAMVSLGEQMEEARFRIFPPL